MRTPLTNAGCEDPSANLRNNPEITRPKFLCHHGGKAYRLRLVSFVAAASVLVREDWSGRGCVL